MCLQIRLGELVRKEEITESYAVIEKLAQA